jgi:DNA topoisomerase-1
LGTHPDDGQAVVTNFGRFGPYVKHGDEFRSLESDDDVFTISLDAAVALLRAPKQSRRRQASTKKVLREIGAGDVTLKVMSGRYGPYVTDGTTNASLPRGTVPEALTPEHALELLAARRDAVSTRRLSASPRTKAARRSRKGAGRTAKPARERERV